MERATAKRCTISDLLDGEYVMKEGTTPNHFRTVRGPVSRVNVIAAVVAKLGDANLLIDDGTGRIEVRAFDDNKLYSDIKAGDVILLIGRPREYRTARYIVAEIVKRLSSPAWLALRKAELATNDGRDATTGRMEVKPEDKPPLRATSRAAVQEAAAASENHNTKNTTKNTTPEPTTTTPPNTTRQTTTQELTNTGETAITAETILTTIRECDAGDGALVEDVLAKTGCTEKAITLLLAEGEIYEKKPGRLKVL